MRDHDDGQAVQFAQLANQQVDAVGAVGVEPGGGLVEEQQFGVERERARQRGTLEHAAAELRRVLRADLALQAAERELPGGDLVDQGVLQRRVFAQRQAHVLQHAERGKQAAVLEHHAPALAQLQGLRIVDRAQVRTQHAHAAAVGVLQQDHFAQERGLARSDAADQREYFAAAHLQAQVFVHDMVAKARADVAEVDHGFAGGGCVCHVRCHGQRHRSSALKAIENRASATITRKIDCTTLRVVWRPTLSAPPWVRKPWKQPTMTMMAAKTGALRTPIR